MGKIIKLPEQAFSGQLHSVGDLRNVPGELQTSILQLARSGQPTEAIAQLYDLAEADVELLIKLATGKL